ncbi:MAG TPA: hypothetical protein VE476_06760 [Propionibacteriaceae bacterium]|jgi:hypothetical protein|nr:hypothetical protein [Propionibacteriaceae bacterium]
MSTTRLTPPPPTDASSSPSNTPEHGLSRALGAAVAVALVLGLVLLAFGLPAVQAKPHQLPIGLVAPPPAVGQVVAALDQQAPDAFAVTEFADEAALTEAIRDREVYGGLVLGAGRPVVLTASAASTAAAQTLAALAPALSRDGTTPEVRDVVPLPDDDPRGAGLAALVLPLVLGAIVPAAVLGSLHLRRGVLLTATIAYAVVGGTVFAMVLHWVFGTLTGDFVTDALVLAAIVGASTLALVGLQWVAGTAGLGLGALLLALVGNPLSGASTAPEFLASPWREIGQAMPPGAGAQLIRSVSFFDGAQSAGPWWVLIAWATAGLVLLALPRRQPAPH